MPVIAIADFPIAALLPMVNVNVLIELAGFGANVALTPFGRPLAINVTS
jgi:hypothetical protein